MGATLTASDSACSAAYRETGVEKIIPAFHRKFGKGGEMADVRVEKAMQEKNIIFPTDSKLHKDISLLIVYSRR